MNTPLGTVGYKAPELIKHESYSILVDMWSLGVITYILLCGFPPFFSCESYHQNTDYLYNAPFWYFFNQQTPDLESSILSGQHDYPEQFWKQISPEAKSFVSGLLQVDISKRLTAKQAIEHPWITRVQNKAVPLHSTVTRLLRATNDATVKRRTLSLSGGFTTPKMNQLAERSVVKSDLDDGKIMKSPSRTENEPVEISQDVEHLDPMVTIKEGWLEIKTLALWSKYYFELRKGALYFYKQPGDDLFGMIGLDHCDIKVKDASTFEVSHRHKKSIFYSKSPKTKKKLPSIIFHYRAWKAGFRMKDSGELVSWVQTVQMMIDDPNASSPVERDAAPKAHEASFDISRQGVLQQLQGSKWKFHKITLYKEKLIIVDASEDDIVGSGKKKLSFGKNKPVVVSLIDIIAVRNVDSRDNGWLDELGLRESSCVFGIFTNHHSKSHSELVFHATSKKEMTSWMLEIERLCHAMNPSSPSPVIDKEEKLQLLEYIYKSVWKGGYVKLLNSSVGLNDTQSHEIEGWLYESNGRVSSMSGFPNETQINYTWNGSVFAPLRDSVSHGIGLWDGNQVEYSAVEINGYARKIATLVWNEQIREFTSEKVCWKWQNHSLSSSNTKWEVVGKVPPQVVMLLQLMRQYRLLNKSPINSPRGISALQSTIQPSIRRKDFTISAQEVTRWTFGSVYKGQYLELPVMIMKYESSFEEEERFMQYLRLESLNCFTHPNIVQMIGCCQQDHTFVIYENLADRTTVYRMLSDGSIAMPLKTRLKIALDVACVVLHVHSKQIIWGNLNSSNIRIDQHGQVKMCDFGSAEVVITGRKKQPRNYLNYENWMAPEIFLGVAYDQQIDVFSFGVLLLELITRKTFDCFERSSSTSYGIAIEDFEFREAPPGVLQCFLECCAASPHKRALDLRSPYQKLKEEFSKM
eukprot:TRINITY_DN22031_c0_g1_i1.p1 TRINITY_DN22031_c0_g1~~TRINITY_DN22031_c0_g1_i1.p1  ORF type:complete len:919 (-),score=245.49 TRINITY_DN22031_c0_g1_i1:476-3232(-)